jgi:hypothetical protein
MNNVRAVFSVWIAVVCAVGVISGQPKLHVVEGSAFDFGDIYTPSASKILTIKNLGEDTLVILNVGTSCGCTAALASADHLPPGDSGTVSITFDAKRFSGKVEKLVSLTTNDTTQRYFTIHFTANVIKTLEFDPEYLFVTAAPDSITTKELTVTNASSLPIHILSTTTSSGIITVTWDKDKLDPGEDAMLKAVVKLPRRGTYRGNIRITTDHPHHPVLTITYFAQGKEKK